MAAESKHSHERQTLPNAAEALRGCAYRLQLLHVFLKLNFVKNEKLISHVKFNNAFNDAGAGVLFSLEPWARSRVSRHH